MTTVTFSAKDLRRICAICGARFGLHGAAPPHTYGDVCPGFRPKEKA